MTANDHGHVNNLDQNQRETLKEYWLSLITAINVDPSEVINSAMGNELFYLFGQDNPDIVLLRWLRARKWQVSPAVQLMMGTLKWRHEWGLRRLMANGEADLIPEECVSGKMYHMGKDRAGRPITYVHAKEHIRGQFPFEATEKCVIFFMELGRHFAEPSMEEGTVVLDMSNVGLKNLDYQHIKFMVNAMQNYYPECLGVALVVNAPRGFSTVWSVIRSWLDPVVESKIHFVKNSRELDEYIDPAVRPQRLKGSQRDFEFIPATKEDDAQLTVFRKDKEGMEKAQLEHRKAAQHYLDVTLKWATTQTQNDEDVRSDRVKAAKCLSNAYEQLVPYVSTRTHYHRAGVIQESIFHLAYDRICAEGSGVVHF